MNSIWASYKAGSMLKKKKKLWETSIIKIGKDDV